MHLGTRFHLATRFSGKLITNPLNNKTVFELFSIIFRIQLPSQKHSSKTKKEHNHALERFKQIKMRCLILTFYFHFFYYFITFRRMNSSTYRKYTFLFLIYLRFIFLYLLIQPLFSLFLRKMNMYMCRVDSSLSTNSLPSLPCLRFGIIFS